MFLRRNNVYLKTLDNLIEIELFRSELLLNAK